MTNAHELIDQLAGLEQERARMLRELNRSLYIKELWPEAFAHGKCTSTVVGNLNTRLDFIIEDGAGNTRTFDLRQIPQDLWPEEILDRVKHPENYPGKCVPLALKLETKP